MSTSVNISEAVLRPNYDCSLDLGIPFPNPLLVFVTMEDDFAEWVLDLQRMPQTKPESPNDFPLTVYDDAVTKKSTGKLHYNSDVMQSRRFQRTKAAQQSAKVMVDSATSRTSPLDQLSNEKTASMSAFPRENQRSASTINPRQRFVVAQQISTPGAIAVYHPSHVRRDEEEDSTEYVFSHPTVPILEGSDASAVCQPVRELTVLPSVPEERVPERKQPFGAKHWKKWFVFLFLIVGTVVGIAVAVSAHGGSDKPSSGIASVNTAPTPAPQSSMVVSSLAPTASAWDILGTPIWTGAQNISFVSLSGNALVVAVSNDGMVGVFRFNSVSRNWTRLGQTMEGTDAHINSDGTIIVVRKESSANVTVLGFNSSTDSWRILGGEIVASSIVNCVAIAGNGQVVALGYDHIILTFMINGNEWQLLGSRVVDTFTTVRVCELSLSTDGMVMAGGFTDHDVDPKAPISRIWIFRGTTWVQGIAGYNRVEYLDGGHVSVSGDGRAFTSGDYGVIDWRQSSDDGFPEKENYQISRFDEKYETVVSLSSDGSVMAAASDKDVSVWEMIGSEWEQIGLFTVEGSVQSVSLSADGSTVAVGILGANLTAMVYLNGI